MQLEETLKPMLTFLERQKTKKKVRKIPGEEAEKDQTFMQKKNLLPRAGQESGNKINI